MGPHKQFKNKKKKDEIELKINFQITQGEEQQQQ